MSTSPAYRVICSTDVNTNTQRIKEFVANSDQTSLYHLPEWCELIHRVFQHKVYYLYVENKSHEVVGVLPLVRLKSRLFGDYIVSMPYFNYGGAIGETEEIEAELLEKAKALAIELGVGHMEFRDTQERKGDWNSIRTDKVNMILELPSNPEILWKAIGAKRRAQIKRPQREGIEVETGNNNLLDEFYSVFSKNMRDLGTPVYGKIFFREILQTFPDSTQIVIVRLGDMAVGAAFLIGFKNSLEVPWASTLRKYNSLGINMYLYWEILKYAISRKYDTFDFGRSSLDSGTYRFKKQWGAQPKQLYWHYWVAEGTDLPELTPNNPKYLLAIKTWQRLPLSFTNWLGPKLVKNLP